jgi:hypothetical protein
MAATLNPDDDIQLRMNALRQTITQKTRKAHDNFAELKSRVEVREFRTEARLAAALDVIS